jgi:hypothetical protein
MKHRSPLAVFLLSLITFGIYALVWEVKTKNEMNKLGASIPTAWLLIIPFANLYWLWCYSQGVEKVTGGKLSGILAFVLLFLLGVIGMAIVQSEFNKVGAVPATAAAPAWQPPTQPGQPLPDNSFGGPVAPTPPVAPQATTAPVAPSMPVTNPEPPQPPNPTPPQVSS